jgi:hypothetical protein
MTTPGDNPVNPLYAKIIGFEGNAIGWARDATLLEILNRSDLTNTILSEYVKKVAPDLTAKLERAEGKNSSLIGRKIDEQTETEKKIAKDREKADQSQEQAIYDLKSTLRGRLDTINSVLKANDPAALANVFGQGLEKVGGSVGGSVGRAFGGARGAVFGKVIGLAAGAVVGASLTRTLEISKTFRDLYDTGMAFNGSMSEMMGAAKESGLSLESMAAQMTKFSTVGIALGQTNMVKFGKSLLDSTRAGADFAMGVEQMHEMGNQYLEGQILSGQALNKSQDELKKGAYDYLQNLTGLSVLTGKSRKAEADALKAKMAEAKTKAAMALLSPEDRKALESKLAQTPAEMRDYVRAAFVEMKTGFPAMTQEMRNMGNAMFTPEAMEKFNAALGNNEGSLQEYMTAIVNLGQNTNQNAARFALLNSSLTGAATTAFEFSNVSQAIAVRLKELEKEMPDATPQELFAKLIKDSAPKESTKAIISAQNEVEMAMNKLKNSIDQTMVESVSTVVEQLQKFGSAIEKVLGKIGVEQGLGPTVSGILGSAAIGATTYAGYKYGANRLAPAGALPTPPTTEALPKPPTGPSAPAAPTAGSKALDLARTGLKVGGIGGIGGALAGVGEYMSSGDLLKSVTVGGASLIGGALGTVAGGAAGSVVPVAGTAAGGVAGGIAGSMIGESVGRWLFEKLGGKEKASETPTVEPIKSTTPPTPTVEPATKNLQSTAAGETARAETPAAGGTSTPVDPATLSRKTLEYYETARVTSQNMIDLLAQLNEKLVQLDETTKTQTSDLSRSFDNAGKIF